MNKITRLITAVMLVTGMTTACTDLNDLQKKVESLESRVTALETLIPNLNSNVEALQVLVNGTTINSATESNGVWTLVLSNGQTITLTAGSIGVGNAPVMSVDKDGYWMVDYGQGAEYILINGEKVKALGTDGKTPVFGVDAEGYWTVSYDGGSTFTQVKDADGQPVSALPTGEVQDPYFEDVKFENGIFTVTLRNGEVLNIPVIPDFLCAIESTGILTYNYSETKPYNVTMKGVGSTMITAPHGWTAVLNGNVLSVTAPAAPTKAILADSGSDVCILAFAATGSAATIAKVQVRLSDSPVTEINPIASVTAGEATETTLTYNVALSDATSYKYIHQLESETVPDAAKIAAEGTESTETSLTISELDNATTYALYVLPINGEKQGAVASGKNTTKKLLIASYHTLYEAGETITIDGIAISKKSHGDATLLSENTNISADGVYFIKEGITASLVFNDSPVKKLIVIGDKEGTKATLKTEVDKYIRINGKGDNTGYIILHNIIFDQSAKSSQYGMTVFFNEYFPLFIFSDCKILQNSAKPIFYIANDNRGFADLRFVNCECNIAYANPIINISDKKPSYGKYTVKNCIFYGDGSKSFNFFTGINATCNEVVFTNNTIVNVLPNNSFFNFGTIEKATVTGNLFYADVNLEKDMPLLNSSALEGDTINNNICYTGQGKAFVALTSGSVGFTGLNEFTKLESNPFTGGTFEPTSGNFVPKAEYSSYGAKR